MDLRKSLAFWGLVFCLLVSSAFGWEVLEKRKMGTTIEGSTFISSGNLAGKVAFIDGWTVYISDPVSAGYSSLFSVANLPVLKKTPRGIAFIGSGIFKGYYLLNDPGHGGANSTLYLVSSSGTLIAEVQPDFQWSWIEGMTEIPSGPYTGRIACAAIGLENFSPKHIFIFNLERADRTVRARLEKDIVLSFQDILLPTGITYLPADAPAFADHVVLADVEAGLTESIKVFDLDGNLKATFPGIQDCEALTYIPSGANQGKLLIADTKAVGAAVKSLEGAEDLPFPIFIGPGVYGLQAMTWLKDRQQLYAIGWKGTPWSIPTYLLSRSPSGPWLKESESNYTGFRNIQAITDKSAGSKYYLMGIVSYAGVTPLVYGIHRLDTDFRFESALPLPSEYDGLPFRRIVYIPGAAPAEDRFLLTVDRSLYSFDSNFSFPAEIIDLSAKISSGGPFSYDPAVMRYYLLDLGSGGLPSLLRVFDSNWNELVSYDLIALYARGFKSLTKFTSGDLKGCMALFNGVDDGDNELYVVSFEYRIATDLLAELDQDVLTSGIKLVMAKALIKPLENAIKALAKKDVVQAVAEIQLFVQEVQAQRGTGLPLSLADSWLQQAFEILRGLNGL